MGLLERLSLHVLHRRRAGTLLAAAAAGTVLAGCSSGIPSAIKPTAPTAPRTTPSTPTTTVTASSGPDCPLTGTPAPGGAVPARAAMAVKVGNYPAGRPQSGLTRADVVFEEPVEGGITRFVAVFQCQGSTMVGPVRSARNIDVGILGQLGQPLIVHVGGINPVISDIRASPIVDFELGDYTSVAQHPSGRVAPYDTYTSTTAIWKLGTDDPSPPQPLFTYSATPPAGTAVSSVSIPFSSYSDVHWRYDSTTHLYLRYYGSTPDRLSDGVQNNAANVVVQFVNVYYGPWAENSGGGLEVQANLYTDASGQALVFRNGVEVHGEWSRSALGQPTAFTTTSGTPIDLRPGTTWVELVPTTVGVAVSPAA